MQEISLIRAAGFAIIQTIFELFWSILISACAIWRGYYGVEHFRPFNAPDSPGG